jgi:DNA-binding transcriptional LysR family regulator
MDSRIYSGFIAVAELASVTQAAKRLNLTQSALSRQLKALEASMGLKLFEKVGRGVRLTPAGETLKARVDAVLTAERSLRSLADDLKADQAGLLRIGACSQVIQRYLAGFLPGWIAANTGIELRLEDEGGAELLDRLHAGAVHIAISAAPTLLPDGIAQVLLGKLEFMAVALPALLPAGDGMIPMDAVLDRTILTLNSRHASREVFDAACRLLGRVPRVAMESYSPQSLFAMAEAGMGVAVVPSSAQRFAPGLVARPIALRDARIEFAICAHWSQRAPMPAYGQRFLEALTAHIARVEADSQRRPLGVVAPLRGRRRSGV